MDLVQLEAAANYAKELEYLKSVLDKIKKAEKTTIQVKVKFKAQLEGSVYHLPLDTSRIFSIIKCDIEVLEEKLRTLGIKV
jgi:hypothetical protein